MCNGMRSREGCLSWIQRIYDHISREMLPIQQQQLVVQLQVVLTSGSSPEPSLAFNSKTPRCSPHSVARALDTERYNKDHIHI